MLIVVWAFVAFLLALWSLALWGLHALLTVDPTRLAELKPMIDRIPYGSVIERWIPQWQDLLRLAIDLTQKSLSWLGDLVPVLVWTAWGFGALGLLGLGGLLTLLVKLVRKTTATAASNAQGAAAAAK